MPHFFASIYGAGLAGLALANRLSSRGLPVLVMDPRVTADEIPGPPAALVNPAMGRHAAPGWEPEACYRALRQTIDDIRTATGRTDLIAETGVLRPATTPDLAASFPEAITRFDWPEGWISWLSAEEAAERVPVVAKNFGALWLPSGYTVFVDNYLNAYRAMLRARGVVFTRDVARYERTGTTFELRFDGSSDHEYRFPDEVTSAEQEYHNRDEVTSAEDGYRFPDEGVSAEHVIVAAGGGSAGFSDWDYLKLHRVKGQIAVYACDEDIPWDAAVSALGYALRRGAREVIIGSTYEHQFRDLDITAMGAAQLQEKLDQMLPGLASRCKPVAQMAGVRVSTPNRLPVAGPHREIPGLHIFTGLGSKGLLHAEHTSGLLAASIIENQPIPIEVSTMRY